MWTPQIERFALELETFVGPGLHEGVAFSRKELRAFAADKNGLDEYDREIRHAIVVLVKDAIRRLPSLEAECIHILFRLSPRTSGKPPAPTRRMRVIAMLELEEDEQKFRKKGSELALMRKLAVALLYPDGVPEEEQLSA